MTPDEYLAETPRALIDAIGRLIQEAKHHHAGKGQPLDGPGNLPAPVARCLAEVERLSTCVDLVPRAGADAMLLYDWDTAPADLRALSLCGGDEDGILVVPPGREPPWWFDRLWCPYGDPQIVERADGSKVYIWAHS